MDGSGKLSSSLVASGNRRPRRITQPERSSCPRFTSHFGSLRPSFSISLLGLFPRAPAAAAIKTFLLLSVYIPVLLALYCINEPWPCFNAPFVCFFPHRNLEGNNLTSLLISDFEGFTQLRIL